MRKKITMKYRYGISGNAIVRFRTEAGLQQWISAAPPGEIRERLDTISQRALVRQANRSGWNANAAAVEK